MKLEIRPAGSCEKAITGRLRLERGEMTIGRDPGCTVVVNDDSRTVSKTHCRILRDGVGFVLRDESVNGVSLGDRELAEGEALRLVNGDEIRFCGYHLRVRISGDEEPDWSDPDQRLALSDEAPSITAILADVAPAGRGAGSMLPGHFGEDWMQAEPLPRGNDPLAGSATTGWVGPPSLLPLGSTLPEDWNMASDSGSRNEHVAATGIRVSVARTAEAQAPPAMPDPDVVAAAAEAAAQALINAFLQGYGAPLEVLGDPRLFIHRMGHSLRLLVDHSSRVAAETGAFASTEGVDWGAAGIDPQDPRDALSRAEVHHRSLIAAASWLLGETDRLAPPVIAGMAQDAQPAKLGVRLRDSMLPGRDAGRAWRGYYSAYYVDGATPRVRFGKELSRKAQTHGQADSFEELKADSNPHGASR
ncbi:MAG: FHA domain-containing protein [Alphaproteobacteria bacterium]|nr:FHA domain-containing protein [Alphaproteobacteria bacterium]